MKIYDVMKTPVVTVASDLPIEEAFEIMKKKGFRHLPVVDNDGLITGIVSDKDLRQALVPVDKVRSNKRYFYFKNLIFVQDVMTVNPICIKPDMDVDEVAFLLYSKKISALPVVENLKIVGIVTESDLLLLLIGILGLLKNGMYFILKEGEDQKALSRAIFVVTKLGGRIISITVMPQKQADDKSYRFRVDIEERKRKELMQNLKDEGLDITVCA